MVRSIYDIDFYFTIPDGAKVFAARAPIGMRPSAGELDMLCEELKRLTGADDVESHSLNGRVIGYTARGRYELTVPVGFDAEVDLAATYELLKMAGFDVNPPEQILRRVLISIPPSVKLMDDDFYKQTKSNMEYHYREYLDAARTVARYEAKVYGVEYVRNIRRDLERIKELEQVESVELQPYRLIIKTKPITLREGEYEWTNSYTITINFEDLDIGGGLVEIHGEKEINGICHPHVSHGRVCSSNMDQVIALLARGKIYDAVALIMAILNSYNRDEMPYATVTHLAQTEKQMREVIDE